MLGGVGGGVVAVEEINVNINFSWNKYLIPSLLAVGSLPPSPLKINQFLSLFLASIHSIHAF